MKYLKQTSQHLAVMEHEAGIEWVTGHRLGSGHGQGSGHEFGLGINTYLVKGEILRENSKEPFAH